MRAAPPTSGPPEFFSALHAITPLSHISTRLTWSVIENESEGIAMTIASTETGVDASTPTTTTTRATTRAVTLVDADYDAEKARMARLAAAAQRRAAARTRDLTALLRERPDLTGVHVPADFAVDGVRWCA